jgi:hypothetical protein
VKRLVHYCKGITMGDTLGGGYIAVKPQLLEEVRDARLQRLLHNAKRKAGAADFGWLVAGSGARFIF